MLSSRDADPNIEYSLSFTVSFGPPSLVRCFRNGSQLLHILGLHSQITREVIRSRYISSTQPDMSRITIKLGPQKRVERTYTCYMRPWSTGNFDISASVVQYYSPKGNEASASITVTGE